jgi:hypothetical protein
VEGLAALDSPHLRRVLVLAACLLLVVHAGWFEFVNDDAFISFRYADNLVRHGELTFNPGERVEGYTNFLWTLTMAGVLALGGDPVPWGHGLGVLFGVGTLLLVVRFLARWRAAPGARPEPRAVDALAALWLAAAPGYACWSSGGLETQQFTCLATLGLLRFLLEGRDAAAGLAQRVPWSGAILGLSAMARPEGMLLFGLCGLARVVEWARARRLPAARDWLWGAGFVAVFGPYFAWRFAYYGWPFPNTYYVKTGAASFWRPGLLYAWSFVRDHHLWAWLPIVFLLRGERRLLGTTGLVIAGVSLHVVRVGGDFMALGRFLVPLLPLFAILLVRALEALRPQLTRLPRRALVALALAVAAGLGARTVQVDRWAMTVGSEGGVDRIGWLKLFAGQCTAVGKHLAATAPPDASLATTAAGIIPYYSRLYTLDVLGLNDEWIAHKVEPRGNRPGHTRVAPESYVLQKQIDYLVYHPTLTDRPSTQPEATRRAWQAKGYVWVSERVPGLEPPYWSYWRRQPR